MADSQLPFAISHTPLSFMPASTLRSRLQRLRLQKIKRELPPSGSSAPERSEFPSEARSLDLPGKEVRTRLGAFQLIETHYPLDHQHGPTRFGDLFSHAATTAALLARDEALARTDLRSLAFFDTETTGLGGGAGTLIFLAGLGVFEDNHFVLRQYFMRDPGEEEALLNTLVADLAPRAGWVTFNGRSFDLPLLETRLTLIGQRGVLGHRPHLDLLHPARRLYAGRFANCKLGEIEHAAFHIIREQDDVTGGLIPQMYLDYLRTHDPENMRRVIYHNSVDILSMVTLATHLLQVFSTELTGGNPKPQISNPNPKIRHPQSAISHQNSPAFNSPIANPQLPITPLQPEDYLRLARWHADAQRDRDAEAAYRRALEGKLSLEARRDALTRFAALLKKQDRRAEAALLWEQLASFTLDDPEPFIELAKFYEWHETNILNAIAWTKRALAVVADSPKGWQKTEQTSELHKRLERLNKKQLAYGL